MKKSSPVWESFEKITISKFNVSSTLILYAIVVGQTQCRHTITTPKPHPNIRFRTF